MSSYGQNGNDQLLRGRLTGNQNNNPQGNQQQQQQGNISNNPLASMFAAASKYGDAVTGQNNGNSIYSWGASKTNYASLVGLDESAIEEQMKQQAISESGHVSDMFVRSILQRRTGTGIWSAWKNGLERFKYPNKSVPQAHPVLVDFVNEIENTPALLNFVLLHSGIQFGSVYAQHLVAGDESGRQNQNVLFEMWYRCVVDTVNLQFIHWISHNPEGSRIYYNLDKVIKDNLSNIDNTIAEIAMNRYVYIGLSCPYRKGSLSKMMDQHQVTSPLLEITEPRDMGLQGISYNPNQDIYSNGYSHEENAKDVSDMAAWIAEKARRNSGLALQGMTEPAPKYNPNIPQTTYNDYDKPKLMLADMTFDNRHTYKLSDYATNIPGCDWYLMEEKYSVQMLKHLIIDDGSTFRWSETRSLGTIPVYRFNWQSGTFNYKLIPIDPEMKDPMSFYLSDPEKMLPLMFEENGVQKTTFDPHYMETDKFVRNEVIVPIGEMKELEKEPQLLVGSKPMKADTGNENTLSRVDIFTETHDPKSKLNAFVLPMVNSEVWRLESNVNMEQFYSQFKIMIPGNLLSVTDTSRAIRQIRGAYTECQSEEFKEFIRDYLTNLVNRWLVEERGYAETKEQSTFDGVSNYLHIGNIFDDLEDLLDELKNNDNPSFVAFVNYSANDFIRSGIEILQSQELTVKAFEEKYKNEEDQVTKAVMMKSSINSIIMTRNSVFINLIKLNAPMQLDLITIKESGNPELFAIVRKAIKIGSRHFNDIPQVIVKFRKDTGNKVWVLSKSGFDPEGVYVLRAVSSGTDYTYPHPINS